MVGLFSDGYIKLSPKSGPKWWPFLLLLAVQHWYGRHDVVDSNLDLLGYRLNILKTLKICGL